MHKTYMYIIFLALVIISCSSDNEKHWVTIYPTHSAGLFMTQRDDSICFEYFLPEYSPECGYYITHDSITNESGDIIGSIGEDKAYAYIREMDHYLVPFTLISLEVSRDSIINELTSSRWQMTQNKFNYKIDFTDNKIYDYGTQFFCVRHKESENDSLLGGLKIWEANWFVTEYYKSFIFGINLHGYFDTYQLFKIHEVNDSAIVLVSIFELDDYSYEVDTTKSSGQKYYLKKLSTLKADTLVKRQDFFKGTFRAKNIKIVKTTSFGEYKMDEADQLCNSGLIQEITFIQDTIELYYSSGSSRTAKYRIDHQEDYLILNDGSSTYDYIEYNLIDSTLYFYDRLSSNCNTDKNKYDVVETILKLEK